MITPQLFLFFLFGLILGSFFNVVGLRLPKGELFKEERSYCPQCYHTLQWYELIPVLSFILQKGKCRTCHKQISWLYPVMEILTGLLFAMSYLFFGLQLELVLAVLLVSFFHIIVVSDWTYMIIPDKVLLFFLPLFVIYRIIDPLTPWWSSVAGSLGAYLILAAIILISRGGMGGGDMKLFALLGFVYGWKLIIVTFFLSTLIGSVISGILLGAGLISRKHPIPFGPFIVVSAVFVFFSGNMVIDWYLQTFF